MLKKNLLFLMPALFCFQAKSSSAQSSTTKQDELNQRKYKRLISNKTSRISDAYSNSTRLWLKKWEKTQAKESEENIKLGKLYIKGSRGRNKDSLTALFLLQEALTSYATPQCQAKAHYYMAFIYFQPDTEQKHLSVIQNYEFALKHLNQARCINTDPQRLANINFLTGMIYATGDAKIQKNSYKAQIFLSHCLNGNPSKVIRALAESARKSLALETPL